MIEKHLGLGVFPDVAVHQGKVWVAWMHGEGAFLVSLEFDTLRELSHEAITLGPGAGAFCKLHAQDGRLWLVYREGQPGEWLWLLEVGTSNLRTLMRGHGNDPALIGAAYVFWQSTGAPAYRVRRRPLIGTEPPRDVRDGAPTGLSRVVSEQEIRLVDEDRTWVSGMTRPAWAGDCVVGEYHRTANNGVLARLADMREIVLWGAQESFTPRVAWDGGDRFVVVTWGNAGVRAACVTRDEFTTQEPPIQTLGRPAFVGGFYRTTDKYPQTISDYPQHVEVIVEPSAIARATTPVIAAPDALSGVVDPSRVIGLYVAAEAEGTASALDLAAELARARWRQRFPTRPVPAVVGYVTRGMAARPTWPPRSVDVFAPEIYFDSTPSVAALQALMAGWEHVLSAARPWLLIGQAYDRGGVQRDQMGALAAVTPAYLELLRARPWILGILWFAVNRQDGAGPTREGGIAVYPELLEPHRRIFAAIPGAPATLPVAEPEPDPDPDPGGDVIAVTPGAFSTIGKVGEPAFVEFAIESDRPVTEITIDLVRDGLPGRTVGRVNFDLRQVRGISLEMQKAGNFSWQVSAKNDRGEENRSTRERTIEVAPL